MMARIRRVKVWRNTAARANRRWIVLASALVGGVSNVRLARRLDRMEARLAAVEERTGTGKHSRAVRLDDLKRGEML